MRHTTFHLTVTDTRTGETSAFAWQDEEMRRQMMAAMDRKPAFRFRVDTWEMTKTVAD